MYIYMLYLYPKHGPAVWGNDDKPSERGSRHSSVSRELNDRFQDLNSALTSFVTELKAWGS
jgi:hypothetical protein